MTEICSCLACQFPTKPVKPRVRAVVIEGKDKGKVIALEMTPKLRELINETLGNKT